MTALLVLPPAMAANLLAMASNLVTMASNPVVIFIICLQPSNDGLQPTGDGLQPTSDGLPPTSDGFPPTSDGLRPTSDCLHPAIIAMASNVLAICHCHSQFSTGCEAAPKALVRSFGLLVFLGLAALLFSLHFAGAQAAQTGRGCAGVHAIRLQGSKDFRLGQPAWGARERERQGQTDRQTDRPTDPQTDRRTDRPTDRQTDRLFRARCSLISCEELLLSSASPLFSVQFDVDGRFSAVCAPL